MSLILWTIIRSWYVFLNLCVSSKKWMNMFLFAKQSWHTQKYNDHDMCKKMATTTINTHGRTFGLDTLIRNGGDDSAFLKVTLNEYQFFLLCKVMSDTQNMESCLQPESLNSSICVQGKNLAFVLHNKYILEYFKFYVWKKYIKW